MKIKIHPIYSPDGKYARCGKCGMSITKKAWKCKSCGTRIDWSMPEGTVVGFVYDGKYWHMDNSAAAFNTVTVTQAQYNALSTAEKNNGTYYYISDGVTMQNADVHGIPDQRTIPKMPLKNER